MNISEMHSVFRTIGQQMGLQLVRGILPESIDVFLNDVIQEKVQQELLVTTKTVIQENVDSQATTMGGVNLLRSLFRSYRFPIGWYNLIAGQKEEVVTKDEVIGDDFSGGALGYILYYNPENSYTEILLPTKDIVPGSHPATKLQGYDPTKWNKINPMMYLGFSVEYIGTRRGNSVACRMIGADTLDTTLRDFCNGAERNYPIVVLLSDEQNRNYIQLHINSKETVTPYITIKYIKTPDTVKLAVKDGETSVDCDLPEYCHYEIVERAVQKYKIAIGGQVADSRNNR